MRYHNISKDDFLNGDGIRAVLFVSGCTHACPECHNPITWDKNGGLLFDEAAKAELFEYLENDYVTGITFSGGDPLAPYNRDEVLALMEEIREKFPNKTTWCYTGFTKEELIEQGFWDKLKPNIDVLVEGEYKAALRSVAYHWAGSINQRILRAETNFEVNTSDPIYETLIEAQNKLSHLESGASFKNILEGMIKTAGDALYTGALNPDVVSDIKTSFLNTIDKNMSKFEDDKDVCYILEDLRRDFEKTCDDRLNTISTSLEIEDDRE